ncbi:MAG: ferrous iron transport protein B [Parachlamydiales bacterium]|jgi:ferrous iron transport protein B
MKHKNLTVGFIGNPNVGKTTLFNTLTGSRQHVGNWPGKTVEKKEGTCFLDHKDIKLVDLPGSYSLTAYSEEELIAVDFVLEKKADIIIQIIDAQNLIRNLFLTIQLLELGAPLVIALNMHNLAELNGIKIDKAKLSLLLGVPVIKIDARNKKSARELIGKALELHTLEAKSAMKLSYGSEINEELDKIKEIVRQKENEITRKDLDWISIKLLENDCRINESLLKKDCFGEIQRQTTESIKHLERVYGQDINTVLIRERYGFIKGLEKEVVTQQKKETVKVSDKFDNWATHWFWGLPLFLLIIWLVFQITFAVSDPLVGGIEKIINIVGNYCSKWMIEQCGASDLVRSFVVDGIIGGTGSVLAFVPIIGMMFLMITILEDTGYMSRVAYVMDRFMHKIGLHGNAFIPLILGFGCNVAGIMAARTLKKKEDRLLTILINPLISCGARLPVYAFFAGAFFAKNQGQIIFSLYFLGILLAIIMGFIFKKIFFKHLSSPFVIELPPYRYPSFKGVFIHIWEKIWLFIKKAGTIILAFSMLIWALSSFPLGVKYGSEQSLAGRTGKMIAPVFKPLGFGNWQSSIALVFGVVAKEVVGGTFGTLYGIAENDNSKDGSVLKKTLKQDFTPLSAYSFMVFVLLYVPCIATLAVIKKETNSWKWVWFVLFYTMSLAWIISFLVYQSGKLLGFP